MGRSVAMPSQDVILDARKDAGEAVKIRAGSRRWRFGFYSELLKRHPAIFYIAYKVKHAVFGHKGAEV